MDALILLHLYALRACMKAFISNDERKHKIKTCKLIIELINKLYELPIDEELRKDLEEMEKDHKDFLEEYELVCKLLDDVCLN